MQNFHPQKLISKGFQAPSKEVRKVKLDLSGYDNRNMDFCLLNRLMEMSMIIFAPFYGTSCGACKWLYA